MAPPPEKPAPRRPRTRARVAPSAAVARPAGATVAIGERPSATVPARPSKTLDVFPNPAAARDYLIHMQVPEFTCLCPLTGQPDFAVLTIDYVPDAVCIELKSLKLYAWSFRDEGAFHEAVTNRVLDDLARAAAPRFMRVTARWGVRGGIFTNIVVEHRRPGWQPPPPVELAAFGREASTL